MILLLGEIKNLVLDPALSDHERYKILEKHILNQANAISAFKLQTLPEAQMAASIIAKICPNPRLAAVGLLELLINSIEHGNLGIGFEEKTRLYQSKQWLDEIDRRLALPDNQQKYVTVYFQKSEHLIHIRIVDDGQGFNWNTHRDLEAKRVFDPHGRGILMARHLAFKEMIYHGKGNEVECTIELV